MNENEEAVRSGREYPQAPIVGVAAVVLRGNDVLLIRRGREPLLGAWSLPGGALELGETTSEGVVREVLEETGLRVRPVEIVATVDRIVRDEHQRTRFHYVLIEWLCFVEDEVSEPVCGDDAVEAKWVPRTEDNLAPYGLDEAARNVVHKAIQIAETVKR
ncbi:MAG TPA: NUDIX hydrolase [Edaphobacter sp.]|nr:NUDIX hydrolase [Edaphobacter sp.]